MTDPAGVLNALLHRLGTAAADQPNPTAALREAAAEYLAKEPQLDRLFLGLTAPPATMAAPDDPRLSGAIRDKFRRRLQSMEYRAEQIREARESLSRERREIADEWQALKRAKWRGERMRESA